MAGDAHTTRWLVLYGAHLFPPRLAAILGDAKPVSSSTVTVRDAFLAFDVPGVPFLEPVYANALLKGLNDAGEWQSTTEKDGGRDGEAYKRWVWERVCPGMTFEGSLPPNLEGMAYELPEADFEAVLKAARAASPNLPSSLYPVCAVKFANGDPSKPLGEISAELLALEPSVRPAGLQPSPQYLGLVLRGAFLNALSRPYVAYLTLIRPYVVSTPEKKRVRTLFRLLLLPSFILFYLPSRILGIPQWRQLGSFLLGGGVTKLRLLEGYVRKWTGSGYVNENDHKALQAMKL
ncbi:hypothetical protein JCM10207_003070 [Rhodosporidiobolus poonsookiae]